MTPKTPKQLSSDITAGKFKPVYYFFGTEDYRIVEAEKFLAKQFLPGPQMMTNYRRLDGKRTKATDLIAELSVYPMLGERQVFVVTGFQSYKPTEVDRVLAMLQPPDPNRVVVFSSPSDKAPKKTSAFIKKLAEVAEIVEFRKLTAGEMAAIVRRKLESEGMTIGKEALQLFIELIAGNRGALEAEVDKLVNYRGAGGEVTSDDVRLLTSGFQVFTVFELADHIVAGDVPRVLTQVRKLIAEGTSLTGVLFHVGNHFVSLYLVKNGRPLPSNRRFLEWKYRRQAPQFNNRQLEQAIEWIAEADAALRRSPVKPELLLESLVLQLVRAA